MKNQGLFFWQFQTAMSSFMLSRVLKISMLLFIIIVPTANTNLCAMASQQPQFEPVGFDSYLKTWEQPSYRVNYFLIAQNEESAIAQEKQLKNDQKVGKSKNTRVFNVSQIAYGLNKPYSELIKEKIGQGIPYILAVISEDESKNNEKKYWFYDMEWLHKNFLDTGIINPYAPKRNPQTGKEIGTGRDDFRLYVYYGPRSPNTFYRLDRGGGSADLNSFNQDPETTRLSSLPVNLVNQDKFKNQFQKGGYSLTTKYIDYLDSSGFSLETEWIRQLMLNTYLAFPEYLKTTISDAFTVKKFFDLFFVKNTLLTLPVLKYYAQMPSSVVSDSFLQEMWEAFKLKSGADYRPLGSSLDRSALASIVQEIQAFRPGLVLDKQEQERRRIELEREALEKSKRAEEQKAKETRDKKLKEEQSQREQVKKREQEQREAERKLQEYKEQQEREAREERERESRRQKTEQMLEEERLKNEREKEQERARQKERERVEREAREAKDKRDVEILLEMQRQREKELEREQERLKKEAPIEGAASSTKISSKRVVEENIDALVGRLKALGGASVGITEAEKIIVEQGEENIKKIYLMFSERNVTDDVQLQHELSDLLWTKVFDEFPNKIVDLGQMKKYLGKHNQDGYIRNVKSLLESLTWALALIREDLRNEKEKKMISFYVEPPLTTFVNSLIAESPQGLAQKSYQQPAQEAKYGQPSQGAGNLSTALKSLTQSLNGLVGALNQR